MGNELAVIQEKWFRRDDTSRAQARLIGAVCTLIVQCALISLFLIARQDASSLAANSRDAGSGGEISVSLLNGSSQSAARKLPQSEPPKAEARALDDRPLHPIDTQTEAVRLGEGAAESITPANDAGSGGFEASEFLKRLAAHIAANHRYPAAARHDKLAGAVDVLFTMDQSGAVLGVWVVRSSGSPLLDRAAVETVLRAQPLPPIPKALPPLLNVTIPVTFDLPP